MKTILFTFISFLSFCSSGQLHVEQPEIHYVSKRVFENSDWIKVGAKVLFAQACTTDLPPEYPTGIVFFEHVYSGKERFSMSVEFKDTVIVSVTYYLSAKQDHLLKTLGYSGITGRASAIKGQWTYIHNEGKKRTVIVADRKRMVIVETLNEEG